MSMPSRPGEVAVTGGDQIYKAAYVIWGLRPDKLPRAKYDELNSVLVAHLTRQYGMYTVVGKPFGKSHVFVISADLADPESAPSEKWPCGLDICMVTDAAYKCGRCEKVFYCSEAHQRRDWRNHKVYCIPIPKD